jgi:L-ascorbate metabolism protein UlaG (beta-lactamase superfamily)
MIVRTLSWAGIEVRSRGCRLLIDPLENVAALRNFLGVPRTPLVPVTIDEQTWALVTHLHPDHCDRRLLARLPAGQTLCHLPIQAALAESGVTATATELWSPTPVGPFSVTAVPAHDWRGDDQVAWIVKGEGRRLIHCGDTIWHGRWYEIARRRGPFDITFLPINGVIAQLDGFTPTTVPATLTPEQAIEAALILRARAACAIHHALFHNPPRYIEQPAAVERFLSAAKSRGITAIAPPAGCCLPCS